MDNTWVVSLMKSDMTIFTASYFTMHLEPRTRLHTCCKSHCPIFKNNDFRNSKYDKVLRYEANFTPDENAGFSSFNSLTGGDCFHCHGGILGTDLSYKNNGLDEFPIDSGRGLVTG